MVACRSGNGVGRINEVTLRRARLVLGWVTASVSVFDSRRRRFISVFNQPPRSTQPSTLRRTVKWVPAKDRWCSAAGESRQACCSLQVKLCDPCLSARCVWDTALHKSTYISTYIVVLCGRLFAVLLSLSLRTVSDLINEQLLLLFHVQCTSIKYKRLRYRQGSARRAKISVSWHSVTVLNNAKGSRSSLKLPP